MPSLLAIIDTTPDLDVVPRPLASKVPPTGPRTLLLAPPRLAAYEEELRDAFQPFNRSTTDLQMLDRLSAGLAEVPAATYDLVLLLADGGNNSNGIGNSNGNGNGNSDGKMRGSFAALRMTT